MQQIVICLIRRGEVQRNQGLPPRHTSQQTHNKTRPPTSSAVAHEKQRVPKQEERQLSLATARTTKHLCPITHSTKNRPKFPLRRLVSQKNFPLARPVQLSAADQFGISFVIGIRNRNSSGNDKDCRSHSNAAQAPPEADNSLSHLPSLIDGFS